MQLNSDNIIKLYEEIKNICQNNRLDEWNNTWMYDNNNNLKYYYLIYLDDLNIHYEDINDLQIDLEIDEWRNMYRIDIRQRYKIHNCWYFNEDKWFFVKKYILELIKNQYNSIEKEMKLISLSNDTENVYNNINILLRKEKLDKLCLD